MRKSILLFISIMLSFTILDFPSSQANSGRFDKGSELLTTTPTNPPAAEWTIMVFMNGDNNLEEDALTDFREMARIGSSDKVNIIVQFDRHGRYPINKETNPKWTQTLRFRITKNMEPVPGRALSDIGEANMGDANTLANFVSWAKGSYPARRYMLTIWDHGQGWRGLIPETLTARALMRASGNNAATVRSRRRGEEEERRPVAAPGEISLVLGSPFRSPSGGPYRSASQDETDEDELYNREIQDSLSSILNNQKLDVLGFDACLMAMVETGYAMRNVASVLVGSEDLEPGTGWQYDHWLGRLMTNPSMNASDLGKLLVDSYKERYTRDDGFLEPDPTTTQSAIDISRMEAVATTISAFADKLTQNMDSELGNIKNARNDCSNYAPNPYGEDPPRDYFFHVDFVHFCDRIIARTQDALLRARAEAARNSVLSSVLNNYAGNTRKGSFGSNGIAIYFPAAGSLYRADPFAEGGYEKANSRFPVEFVTRHTWADFLHAYFARVP
jgi:hypothetical protein